MSVHQLPRRRRDPVKPGNRLRIRVNVRPMRTSLPGVVGGVKAGVQEAIINEGDLEAVKAKVEDRPELVEQARQMWLADRQRYIGTRMNVPPESVPVEASEWNEDQRKAEGTYPGSLESFFYTLTGGEDAKSGRSYGRGVRPLIPIDGHEGGVEILERLGPELSEDEQRSLELAQLIGNGGNASGDNMVAALLKEMADMRERMELMQAELQSRRGGRKKAE